jgi:hypothetical protein
MVKGFENGKPCTIVSKRPESFEKKLKNDRAPLEPVSRDALFPFPLIERGFINAPR